MGIGVCGVRIEMFNLCKRAIIFWHFRKWISPEFCESDHCLSTAKVTEEVHYWSFDGLYAKSSASLLVIDSPFLVKTAQKNYHYLPHVDNSQKDYYSFPHV